MVADQYSSDDRDIVLPLMSLYEPRLRAHPCPPTKFSTCSVGQSDIRHNGARRAHDAKLAYVISKEESHEPNCRIPPRCVTSCEVIDDSSLSKTNFCTIGYRTHASSGVLRITLEPSSGVLCISGEMSSQGLWVQA